MPSSCLRPGTAAGGAGLPFCALTVTHRKCLRHLPSFLHQPPNPQIHERPHLAGARERKLGAQGAEALLSAWGGDPHGSAWLQWGEQGGWPLGPRSQASVHRACLMGLERVPRCQRLSRGKEGRNSGLLPPSCSPPPTLGPSVCPWRMLRGWTMGHTVHGAPAARRLSPEHTWRGRAAGASWVVAPDALGTKPELRAVIYDMWPSGLTLCSSPRDACTLVPASPCRGAGPHHRRSGKTGRK